MESYLKLKKSNCKNCYKCIRHCPVKSIRFSGNQAHIVENECILCGKCFVICPQNAKEVVDQTEKVKVMIQSGVPVIASIAPSFIAKYKGVGIEGIRSALKKLGFADAEETAIGATIVKKEYERMLNEDNRDIIITSCCHSINLLIQKHFPQALPYLAGVLSPMQAHCVDIKRRNPEAKTVFIGPCVAKLDEAGHYGDMVDAALTFEQFNEWLTTSNIKLEEGVDNTEDSRARLFPTTGGVLKTMALDTPGYTYVAIDGVENCMSAINDIISGNVHKCFIEMSACVGSCVGGPAIQKNSDLSPISAFGAVSSYAGPEDFKVEQPEKSKLIKNLKYIEQEMKTPSETEICAALRKMGKKRKEDELNCGSCGYNTCREKAIAIVQGKAEVSMCLPFLKDKAESFSDIIIGNTPNGILVLNEELEVQQINRAAMKLMNIHSASDVMGEPVVRILDPEVFMKVKVSGGNMQSRRAYLAEYDKYIEQTVIMDKDYHVIICIMSDVSDQQSQKEKKEEMNRQTVEIADKVVEKQMRIVQEIASLLGETAAETKIALTKLKDSISDE